MLLLIAAAVLLVWVLIQTQAVVLPVIAALLLTAFVEPGTRRLRARRLPDWAVGLIALLAVVALFAGVGLLIVPEVVGQISQVNLNLNQGIRRIQDFVLQTFPVSQSQVEQGISKAFNTLQSSIGNVATQVLGAAGAVVGLLLQIFVTLFLFFFFVKDGPRFYRWLRAAAPPSRRRNVEELLPQVWSTLQAYLSGVVIVGLIDAVFIAIALLVVGVPLVLPLAVLTFFGAFFPLVGAIVAGAVAALVALVTGGVTDALIIVGATVVVQQVEGNVLQPLIMGRQVELHPAVTLLAVTGGGAVAGIVGAFLAVPVAAVTRRVLRYSSPHLATAGERASEPSVARKMAQAGRDDDEDDEDDN
ncbi:MAG: AI-2E family transporter [Actinomycetota bacterium]|nr:AI-2E family transporter [Actinomycetota bacterium]